VTRWPFWRLLVWIEVWLLAVAAFHAYRPIHDAFVVPLLIAIVPAGVVIAMWGLSRGATGQKPTGRERASWTELAVAMTAVVAGLGWVVNWTLQARADLERLDAMLGQATIIIDVSLTGLSLGACFAALTLDSLLATAHDHLRGAMRWLRRTHVIVTAVHVAALLGSAWLFIQVPDTGTAENIGYFARARIALHVYEYSKATIFPVQASFAALAIAMVAAADVSNFNRRNSAR
jgi:hypothetical protein